MKGRQIAAPLRVVLLALIAVFPGPARAQITSGTITGTVHDASGGAIPGASVTLTSLTQGTATDAVTNGTGDFVFPTVRADSYSVKVSLGGFKTLERPNIVVHAGDRVSLGTMSLEVGALAETVTVSGEAPMIQSTIGERAFAITAESVQAIAVNGRNYNTLIALAPGIVAGTVNGLRANQNTFQIDGIGSMDTGNNGSTVSLTTDAVQE